MGTNTDKFWFIAEKYRSEKNKDKKARIAKTGAKLMSEISGEKCFISTFDIIVSDDILLQNYAFIHNLFYES